MVGEHNARHYLRSNGSRNRHGCAGLAWRRRPAVVSQLCGTVVDKENNSCPGTCFCYRGGGNASLAQLSAAGQPSASRQAALDLDELSRSLASHPTSHCTFVLGAFGSVMDARR